LEFDCEYIESALAWRRDQCGATADFDHSDVLGFNYAARLTYTATTVTTIVTTLFRWLALS